MHNAIKNTSVFFAGAAIVALAFGAGLATPSFAEKTVMVGGAEMFPSKNIIQNAIHSQDHTTLVAAVKAAGLVETLSGPGPFTVFAPTNRAFEKLPDGTVPTLLKPENKGKLTSILTYHVVPGTLTEKDLWDMVDKMGGKAELKTVGQTIRFDARMVHNFNADACVHDHNDVTREPTVYLALAAAAST